MQYIYSYLSTFVLLVDGTLLCYRTFSTVEIQKGTNSVLKHTFMYKSMPRWLQTDDLHDKHVHHVQSTIHPHSSCCLFLVYKNSSNSSGNTTACPIWDSLSKHITPQCLHFKIIINNAGYFQVHCVRGKRTWVFYYILCVLVVIGSQWTILAKLGKSGKEP